MDSTDYKIHTIKNEIFSSNTYIVQHLGDNTCIIIDPGLDTEKIKAGLEATGATPVAVLATHGHFDHIGSVSYFQKTFGIPYCLHEKDLKLSQSANFYLKIIKLEHRIDIPVPDHLFKNETDDYNIGAFHFDIYNYPGHSYGSCILKHGSDLFSGDIIYKDGVGLNSFPKENTTLLRASIHSIFLTFSDDCLILPGHGKSEKLGIIKQNNKELQNFIYEHKHSEQ